MIKFEFSAQQQLSSGSQGLSRLLNQAGRRQLEIRTTPLEAFEVLAKAQTIKLLADENRPTDAKMLVGQTVLRGPIHQVFSDRFWISVAIRHVTGEDMPDDDQQFSGDGDDGFFGSFLSFKALELLLPVGVIFDRNPGRFDQS